MVLHDQLPVLFADHLFGQASVSVAWTLAGPSRLRLGISVDVRHLQDQRRLPPVHALLEPALVESSTHGIRRSARPFERHERRATLVFLSASPTDSSWERDAYHERRRCDSDPCRDHHGGHVDVFSL